MLSDFFKLEKKKNLPGSRIASLDQPTDPTGVFTGEGLREAGGGWKTALQS